MRVCVAGLRMCLLVVAAARAQAEGRGQAKGGQTPAPARQAQAYTAPRTADGKPDLQGIWQVMNTASFNLEPHSPALGIRAGTGVITDPADGMIPYLPAAAEKRKQNF